MRLEKIETEIGTNSNDIASIKSKIETNPNDTASIKVKLANIYLILTKDK
jgi:hypothetical protein